MENKMSYNLSEIMKNAWTYRNNGMSMSESMKKAWNEVKYTLENLLKAKKELEDQLESINYQINEVKYETISKEKTYKIVSNERDNVKVWGAIIIGLDKKYGLSRDFKSYRYLSKTSSKHAYYDYYIDIKEGQFFEYKYGYDGKYHEYMKLENGEFINVMHEDIISYFKNLENTNE